MFIEKVLRRQLQIQQIQRIAVRPGDQSVDDAGGFSFGDGLQQQQQLITSPFGKLADHTEIDKADTIIR
ncbi:hypothetical protein D3C72_2407790 [compost metagenome]